ncbi:MAG: hypothetical protein LBP75_09950 [Planctomycetota bacterium]|jgi:hypothetical protein|nr:hypothetical protein [Planctomycetota bacterium]
MSGKILPYAITLTGQSRAGKSFVIDTIKGIARRGDYWGFSPVVVQKYTTRKFRDKEIEAIKQGRGQDMDVKPVIGKWNEMDGANDKQLSEICLRKFKEINCDMAYEQYGSRYGVKLIDIYRHIEQGQTPIIILNDIRVVADLKTLLGEQCYSIFVFREVPDIATYIRESKLRNEEEVVAKLRFQKAEAIYRIYIENIHLFDHLLLNVENGTLGVEKIIKQMLSRMCLAPTKFK